MQSVIFCWLTEVTLSLYPREQRQIIKHIIFHADKTYSPEVAFKATKDDDDLLQKKSVIFCWLTEMTLCHELLPITNWDQWLLKLVEKSLFFLQNTPPCSNTGQRTTASLPLPLRQTHSYQNFQTHHLLPSLTTESTRNLSVRAMPSVSGPTRLGGTGWFNYKALDEPYKAHFARTCIRSEVNRLLCSA